MRAVAAKKFKEAPTLMDLPKPAPGAGEILVQLGAAGINPFDWKILDGALDGAMPHVFPLIAGVDGAGVVEAVGPGVTRFAVGDGVYGQFLHAPVGIGTYAEYVVAPEGLGIAKMPRGMYSAQAAAVPTAGMTALDSMDRLGLTRGQSLLILGAGGGVGTFAVQLASNQGILALAASRTGRNRDLLHKLGAHRYFDSENYRFLEEVRNAYPDGVDGLLDLVNRGEAFTKHLAALKKGGVVVSTIGAATDAAVAPHGVRGVNINLQPKAEFLDRLASEFSSGRMRVPVEETVPLAEAPQALERNRSGESRGKAVIKI